MTDGRRRWVLRAMPALAALAIVLTAQARARAMAPPKPSQRWALIVGRDETGDPRLTQELQALAQGLKNHYGYAPSNVVELYDSQATVEELRRRLFMIVKEIRPPDTLLLYLSLPARGTGEDTVLLTHGGNENEPWTVMPTYELQKVLSGLQARATFIVMPGCASPAQGQSPFVQSLSYSRGAERALFLLTFCAGRQDPGGAATDLASRIRGVLEPGSRASAVTPSAIWSRLERSLPVEFVASPPSGPPDAFVFEVQQGRLDPLLRALASAPTAKEKEAAIGALVAAVREEPAATRSGLTDSVGGVLVPLASTPSEVQARAVVALGEIAHRPAVPILGQLLGSSNEAALRKAALDALARIGGDATLPLIARALDDADPSVRTAAIRALSARKHEASFADLLRLTKDPDESVRVAALQSAATFPGHEDEVRKASEAMLGDPLPTPRREAASVLGGLGKAPTSRAMVKVLLSDPDPRVRQAAAYSVGRSLVDADRPVVEPALVQAAQPASPAELREAAIWALGQIGGPTAERRLRTALADPDVRVRRTAIEKLGELKVRAAVPELIRLLEDPRGEPSGRVAAATALGAIGDSRAAGPLLVALKDANVYVRAEAEKALALLKAPPAPRDAVNLLRDPSPRVRAEAAQKLGEARDPEVTSRLIAALNDNENEVRQAAIRSLARHKDARSVRLLTAALDSPSFQTRQGAVAALGLMGDAAATPVLLSRLKDQNGAVRAEAVRALGRLGQAEEPAVLDTTRDPDPTVRLALVETLAPLKSAEAVNTLRRLSRDPTPEVRSAAILALGGPVRY
jgi:HEAT repeat protein